MRLAVFFLALCVVFATAVAAVDAKPSLGYVELKAENFQKIVDGKKVELYTIKNKNGMEAKTTPIASARANSLSTERSTGLA